MEKAKEKAKKLVERFLFSQIKDYVRCYTGGDNTSDVSDYKITDEWKDSVSSAIIAVDEIIDELSSYWLTEQGMDFVDRIKHLEQVKAELNNM